MSLLKQTSAGGGKQRHLQPVTFKKYEHDSSFCVYTLLAEYITRTAQLRGSTTQLLLCHTLTHGPASRDTILRWLKQVMFDAGLDTSIFKPHSTRSRSAATSAAKSASVPLDETMATAGWRSNSVFAMYYHKPIVSDGTFLNVVLGHVLDVQSINHVFKLHDVVATLLAMLVIFRGPILCSKVSCNL